MQVARLRLVLLPNRSFLQFTEIASAWTCSLTTMVPLALALELLAHHPCILGYFSQPSEKPAVPTLTGSHGG
jgi:hypothetical protein